VKRRRFPGTSATRVQRGFALIAILALAALISAFLIASALNRSATDVSNERNQRTMDALRQAKNALIAYAANEQWQLYKSAPSYFQPGALPSPDMDDDGDADQAWGSNAASQLGRLPFKTLGIDDLRDASGERLWYALSHDFRKLRCSGGTTPPNCTVINSDTQGQLTVTGTTSATQVVAVLFAPGEALQGQNRDPANAALHNSYLNYLEGPPDLSNSVNYVFTSALPSAAFNDRVLIITKAELMAAVEPVVAANIARDVKPLLGDYLGKWGRYPFAVPFASPPASQSAYLGVSPQTNGLFPVTNTATFSWQSPTITQTGGMAGSVVDSWSCSITGLNLSCVVHYTDGTDKTQARPDIQLQIPLSNVNGAFADIPSPITIPENVTMVDGFGGEPSRQASPYGYWSAIGSVVPTAGFVGSALVYTGRLINAEQMNNQVTISFPLPAPPGYLPRLTNPSTTNPNIDWFISNQWYRQTYYVVATGWAPNGVGGCNPPVSTAPACLTVNNLPAPTNNKQAILILAGRALDGQTHPSGSVADYLEGQNATPADLVFEHRAGAPTTINDRVVVVSP
jgi:type II secretory pathway pseudopilin PulG